MQVRPRAYRRHPIDSQQVEPGDTRPWSDKAARHAALGRRQGAPLERLRNAPQCRLSLPLPDDPAPEGKGAGGRSTYLRLLVAVGKSLTAGKRDPPAPLLERAGSSPPSPCSVHRGSELVAVELQEVVTCGG